MFDLLTLQQQVDSAHFLLVHHGSLTNLNQMLLLLPQQFIDSIDNLLIIIGRSLLLLPQFENGLRFFAIFELKLPYFEQGKFMIGHQILLSSFILIFAPTDGCFQFDQFFFLGLQRFLQNSALFFVLPVLSFLLVEDGSDLFPLFLDLDDLALEIDVEIDCQFQSDREFLHLRLPLLQQQRLISQLRLLLHQFHLHPGELFIAVGSVLLGHPLKIGNIPRLILHFTRILLIKFGRFALQLLRETIEPNRFQTLLLLRGHSPRIRPLLVVESIRSPRPLDTLHRISLPQVTHQLQAGVVLAEHRSLPFGGVQFLELGQGQLNRLFRKLARGLLRYLLVFAEGYAFEMLPGGDLGEGGRRVAVGVGGTLGGRGCGVGAGGMGWVQGEGRGVPGPELDVLLLAQLPGILKQRLHRQYFILVALFSSHNLLYPQSTLPIFHIIPTPTPNPPTPTPTAHSPLQQKILIKYIMRGLAKRKARNEPCKSPSPDIAHRSTIKHTTIEVDDIRSKMKKAEEKELKFELQSSLSHLTPSDNNSHEMKYRQLYDEFNRVKSDNKSLSQQNKLLNQENSRLSMQVERNKNVNHFAGALLTKSQNEALREKVILLDEEKKRLEKELKMEREKSEQSFRNIENLRMEQFVLKQSMKNSSRSDRPSLPIPNNDLEARFILLSNNILSGYENKTNRMLGELHSRINKIELMEKILKENHMRMMADSNVNKTPSSAKSSNWVHSTTGKFDSRYKDLTSHNERVGNDGFPLSNSPIERHLSLEDSTIEKLEHENCTLYEEVKCKDSQIERLKLEKENLSATLQQFEQTKRTIKISTPKFNDGEDNFFKKLTILEENVRLAKEEAAYYQHEAETVRQQMTSAAQQASKQTADLLNKIEYLQKILKQHEQKVQEFKQCQQCRHKQQEIHKMMQKFKRTEQRFQHSLNELRDNFQADIANYQKKLEHSESAGSEKFKQLDEQYKKTKELNKQLSIELGSYMMMVQYIKDKLQIQDISEILQENTAIYSQVQTTFLSERSQYDRTLHDLTCKLLAKQQQIAHLQTSLSLKTKQTELLQSELDKIKALNLEYQNHGVNMLYSNLNFMSREKADSKHNCFLRNNENILEKVKSGSEKLDILYQKINNCIHFDLATPKLRH